MAMRLSEIHPALVHFPIALLPFAIGTDAIGLLTRRRELQQIGKVAIAAAATSGAVSALFGLIAQEEVSVADEAAPVLKTHRSLNLAALGAMTALAIVRARKKKASVGTLIAGLGAIAAVTFSAYLGGKLVYAHGAGVARADGIAGPDPQIAPRTLGTAARQAAKDLGQGLAHTLKDASEGEIAPIGASLRATR